MDVVVPHTRTMADLLEVLDVVVADDAETRGDFWRVQPWIELPRASAVRPPSYPALAPRDVGAARSVLAGQRLGVPRMYINADRDAGTADHPGIGGPTGRRIETRASVMALWHAARRDLEAAGAQVVLVDFPVVSNYEGDRPGAPTIATRGLVSPEYLRREIVDLSAWAWDDFLRANGDPKLDRLADVDGAGIFPHPEGALPDRSAGFDDDIAAYPAHVREHGVVRCTDIPHRAEGLRGLEEPRRRDLEDCMDRLGLDAVVFPAVADVGPADMDVNTASADLGWRNGVWVANGNLVPRHLGIPTVTVPMGTMADIGMPVGLTFAGRAYDDTALLTLAAASKPPGPAAPRHPARLPSRPMLVLGAPRPDRDHHDRTRPAMVTGTLSPLLKRLEAGGPARPDPRRPARHTARRSLDQVSSLSSCSGVVTVRVRLSTSPDRARRSTTPLSRCAVPVGVRCCFVRVIPFGGLASPSGLSATRQTA